MRANLTTHEFRVLLAFARNGDSTAHDAWRECADIHKTTVYRLRGTLTNLGLLRFVRSEPSPSNSIDRNIYTVTDRGRDALNQHGATLRDLVQRWEQTQGVRV